jgi:hypothetical protein
VTQPAVAETTKAAEPETAAPKKRSRGRPRLPRDADGNIIRS